jgi:hypothetical protein
MYIVSGLPAAQSVSWQCSFMMKQQLGGSVAVPGSALRVWI